MASNLYKYLDANGGLLMLQNGNLQFPVYEELADGQQPYTMEKLDTRL